VGKSIYLSSNQHFSHDKQLMMYRTIFGHGAGGGGGGGGGNVKNSSDMSSYIMLFLLCA